MNEGKEGFYIVAIWVLILLFAGTYFGGDDLKKKSVEHGCAYYHPSTGEFTWRER